MNCVQSATTSGEKSILIQTYRLAYPTEAEICTEIESRCLQFEPTCRTSPPVTTILGPPQLNAWLTIRDTATEPKISEIFNNLPQDEPIHSRDLTSCVFTSSGSYLYDIGGHGTTLATFFQYSDRIRRLDIHNPSEGWKTFRLPFYCCNALAVASGNFIYMFPRDFLFSEVQFRHLKAPSPSPAYVYDTITQKTYSIKPPFGSSSSWWSRVCVPMEHHTFGCGVLIPVVEKDEQQRVYLHKPHENSWYQLDDFSPIPGIERGCFAVSNGILYVCDHNRNLPNVVLYAYDLQRGRVICSIDLPEFDYWDREDSYALYMVPVSDFEICFLWHEWSTDILREITLHFAKVLVSLHPPGANLIKYTAFEIDASGITNCLLMC